MLSRSGDRHELLSSLKNFIGEDMLRGWFTQTREGVISGNTTADKVPIDNVIVRGWGEQMKSMGKNVPSSPRGHGTVCLQRAISFLEFSPSLMCGQRVSLSESGQSVNSNNSNQEEIWLSSANLHQGAIQAVADPIPIVTLGIWITTGSCWQEGICYALQIDLIPMHRCNFCVTRGNQLNAIPNLMSWMDIHSNVKAVRSRQDENRKKGGK
jgi:hypothetical protein